MEEFVKLPPKWTCEGLFTNQENHTSQKYNEVKRLTIRSAFLTKAGICHLMKSKNLSKFPEENFLFRE